MKNYRVIRPAHRCQTPAEAIGIAETIFALESVAEMLRNIDSKHLAKDHEVGRKLKWLCLENIRLARNYAQNRLRREFLAVEKSERNK